MKLWTTASGQWVPDPSGDTVEHLNGVPWKQAPLPLRWHRCRAQTRDDSNNEIGEITWCACGALRLEGERWWRGKNWRRRNPGIPAPTPVPE